MPIKSEFPDAPVFNQPFADKILQVLWETQARDPNHIAFVSAEDAETKVTYKDLYVYCLSIANYLSENNIGHGDIACLVLHNCWEYFAIFIGMAIVGGGTSGASTLFTDYELERQFNDSKCKIIFCSDNSLEKVLLAAKKCTHIMKIVVIFSKNNNNYTFPFGIENFNELLKFRPNFKRPKINIDINKDILLLPYSSGTTGSPKGVMLCHRNFGTMMNMFVKHFAEQILPGLDKNWEWNREAILLQLPFYHIYGIGVISYAILTGATGIIMSKFDPEIYCQCIQKYKIRLLFLVPPILVILAKNPIIDQYDLSSLEFLLTGGAPAGKELIEEVYSRLPKIKYIMQGYGMTECSMSAFFPLLSREKYSAAGKLLSNYEMKGPTIMMGYLNNPKANEETIDSEGYLITGDIGYLDEDNWLHIVDRQKELIKVQGYQVSPAELEDLLLSHSQIEDCAVIGVFDPKKGEVPKAFVVRNNNTLSEKQVFELIKSILEGTSLKKLLDNVAPYKQLVGGVEFVDEIPKSQAGKILRRVLREQERNKNKQENKN